MIPHYDKLYESLQKQKDLISKERARNINDQILLSEIVNLNPEKYIIDIGANFCLTALKPTHEHIHIDNDTVTYKGKTPLAIHFAFMKSGLTLRNPQIDQVRMYEAMYNKTLSSIFHHLR